MSWAYSPSYGKPLSVPQGVIALMSRFGMDIELAYPEGYNLIPEIVEHGTDECRAAAAARSESATQWTEAMKDADIVYPKSWAPFHIMQQRTELLKKADRAGLKELEQVCLANNARFMDWEFDDGKAEAYEGTATHCICTACRLTSAAFHVRGER
ncbi:MAG: hypothetical protein MZV63_49320 [Marinilabiliales bacterium]|nr:hypothetical protein [Marinilabiliales bacterium]